MENLYITDFEKVVSEEEALSYIEENKLGEHYVILHAKYFSIVFSSGCESTIQSIRSYTENNDVVKNVLCSGDENTLSLISSYIQSCFVIKEGIKLFEKSIKEGSLN